MNKRTATKHPKGKEVRAWRLQHRISQANIADFIGVSIITYSRFEKCEPIKDSTFWFIMDGWSILKKHPSKIEQMKSRYKLQEETL